MTRTLDQLEAHFASLAADAAAEERLRAFAHALASENVACPDRPEGSDQIISLVPGEDVLRRRRGGWLIPAVAASVLVAAVAATAVVDRSDHSVSADGTISATAQSAPDDAGPTTPLVPSKPTPIDAPLSLTVVPQGWAVTSWAMGHVVLTPVPDRTDPSAIRVTLVRGSQPDALDPTTNGFDFVTLPATETHSSDKDGATSVFAANSGVIFHLDTPPSVRLTPADLTRFFSGISTRTSAVAEPAPESSGPTTPVTSLVPADPAPQSAPVSLSVVPAGWRLSRWTEEQLTYASSVPGDSGLMVVTYLGAHRPAGLPVSPGATVGSSGKSGRWATVQLPSSIRLTDQQFSQLLSGITFRPDAGPAHR